MKNIELGQTVRNLSWLWKAIIALVAGAGILIGAVFGISDTRYTTQARALETAKEFAACMEKLKEKDVEQDKLDAAAIYKIELLASDIRGTLKEIKVELRNMRKDK